MAKKKFGYEHNPLAVLLKILSNALLEDSAGINATAYNALLILAGLVDKDLPTDLEKKSVVDDDERVRYRA